MNEQNFCRMATEFANKIIYYIDADSNDTEYFETYPFKVYDHENAICIELSNGPEEDTCIYVNKNGTVSYYPGGESIVGKYIFFDVIEANKVIKQRLQAKLNSL